MSWLIAIALPLLFAAKTNLINGTAAIVSKKVLTIEDAYIYRALVRFRDGEAQPVKLERGDELARTVQKIVLQEIVIKEILSYKFEGTPKKTAEKWLQAEKGKGRDKAWETIVKTFERSEGDMIDKLWEQIKVEDFIQKKIDTLSPIVTEAEAQKYYKQNESRFKGTSFETMRPNIITLLKKQETQKGLDEWIRSLKDRYTVTNILGE